MSAGRPRTPSELRKVSGSHPERLNKREAIFRRVDGVRVPARVAENPYAIELWEEIVPELVANGLLTRANQGLCADLCMAHAVMMKAQTEIDDRGQIVEEEIVAKGEVVGHKIKSNPAVAQLREFMAMKCRLMIEFGMTPASATKVAADPEPERKESFDFTPPAADDEEEVSDGAVN